MAKYQAMFCLLRAIRETFRLIWSLQLTATLLLLFRMFVVIGRRVRFWAGVRWTVWKLAAKTIYEDSYLFMTTAGRTIERNICGENTRTLLSPFWHCRHVEYKQYYRRPTSLPTLTIVYVQRLTDMLRYTTITTTGHVFIIIFIALSGRHHCPYARVITRWALEALESHVYIICPWQND